MHHSRDKLCWRAYLMQLLLRLLVPHYQPIKQRLNQVECVDHVTQEGSIHCIFIVLDLMTVLSSLKQLCEDNEQEIRLINW
jgi:hypothetical protein